MSKRKREADSEDEDITPGKQILPVANLPEDFNAEPADGMEYLFTVRRDARRLPFVTRVENPYTSLSTILPTPQLSLPLPFMPSEEWRTIHESHFRNLRRNLPVALTQLPESSSKMMPDKTERDLWWAFLAGKPETEWNPKKIKGEGEHTTPVDAVEPHSTAVESQALGVTVGKPRPPTLLLLKQIDQRYSLHLLMYFAHWINQHLRATLPRISATHTQWMFFLLALVGDHISADQMNTLRSLARAIAALLKLLMEDQAILTETDSLSQTSCWIIITTIAGIWGQRDLWADVQDTLGRVAP